MIELQGVCKSFQSGRRQVPALVDVSFRIEKGLPAAVVGKSGSGKTTLLNCIGGIERPDAGRVICFGIAVHGLNSRNLSLFQRRNLGFIFQQGNLLSYLTVSENIGFPLALNGANRKALDGRVEELLERIGLPKAGRAMPRELSGGEIQRISAARAMAHRPQILLADEPTASLDTETGKDLIEMVFAMAREGHCTVVISTHDPEIVRLADKTICLRDGRRVIDGSQDDGETGSTHPD